MTKAGKNDIISSAKDKNELIHKELKVINAKLQSLTVTKQALFNLFHANNKVIRKYNN